MVGAVQTILVCADSTSPAAPCPAGQAPTALQAYVIDPAGQSFFDAAIGPYDYTNGAMFWASSFMLIMTLYIGSYIYSRIIAMVR